MIAVALKGLAGRKLRALLTAFAVVIGVSMVSGTFILTDTMQKTFDGLFAASYEDTDAVIAGKQIVETSMSGSTTIPESLLTKVRALPEVGAAGGTVSPAEGNTADIIGSDGQPVANESLGVSVDAANPQFSPLKLKTGEWPAGPDQVVIDAGTAEKQHYAVGDSIDVSSSGETASYTVTGTVSFGDVDSLGFGSIVAWDLETAQAVLDRDGLYDQISIAAKDGTSPAELVKAVRPLLPDTLEVKDSAKQADEASAQIDEGMAYIRYFLLGFGAIALFVGAFVIFNTLSITVAQRTREFATLRTLGASRKQVLRSVRLEGLVIGLLASTIGLFLGFGIAKGMLVLFSAMGVDLPEASTVFELRTVIVSLLLGTGITLLATIVPARRATRVPPIAAVREGSTLPASRFASHSLKAGLGVTLSSLAAISAGVFAGGLSGAAVGLLLGLGVIGLFLGIALLAPRMVKPLARLVGWPARRAGGIAGELAGSNALRNPGRTASTAAALMIGITLVTVVAVLGAGMNKATENAITDQVRASYVVDGQDGLTFDAEDGDELAQVAGVKAASHVRSDKALVKGEEIDVTGIDAATIDQFYRFEWTAGSLEGLGKDGALVTKDYADDQGLAVGDGLALQTPSGEKLALTVRGVYDPPQARQMLKSISIGQATFDRSFPTPKNAYTFLEADAAADAGLEAAVKDSGDAVLHTGDAYAKDATKDMATFLAMLYVLLGFSVVVSLFGMVNTLVLSVFERTRELGMLRAIGMTRRQARRMIRHESVITALIGAVMGLGLGVLLSALVTRALSDYGVPMSLPVATLAGFTLVAVLAGIGAAIMPARRASRLNVLDALHYE
ncbi:MAG TPA: FtsX-like permease family protein, partial [Solirubrobacteraceae bacterium]|nr:FtsX-like permease family protein [Solirubrobacteraceae bacterium]